MHPAQPPSSTKASRLDALLAKREQIERQLKALAAQQSAARRKADQRAKFLLGQAVLTQAAQDPALLDRLCGDLPPKDQALVRATVARLASAA